MAIIERKQLTGSTAKINQYAGHEGQLVFDKTTKHLHVLSGTTGKSTKIANVSDIPAPVDISGKADKTYVDTGLAGKANKAHTHAVADVDGLQTVLNTINGKIPTKTSQLTNDSGFLKTHPNISVAANTLAPGSVATVTKSGTDAAPVFTFGIPKGADGAKGDRGDPGPQGPQGPAGSSAPTPKAYVKSTWRSGELWYRRWSDGWLEQGGRLKLGAFADDELPSSTFSLPTAFSNTTYTTVVTGEGIYGTSTLKVESQLTSSVTVFETGGAVSSYLSYVHFYCSGY